MESAGVLQQESLQQFRIESVHVVNQLVKAVLMPTQAQAQGNLAERGMLIDQQAPSVVVSAPNSSPDAPPKT